MANHSIFPKKSWRFPDNKKNGICCDNNKIDKDDTSHVNNFTPHLKFKQKICAY